MNCCQADMRNVAPDCRLLQSSCKSTEAEKRNHTATSAKSRPAEVERTADTSGSQPSWMPCS